MLARSLVVLSLVLVVAQGCRESTAPAPPSPPKVLGKVRFIDAPREPDAIQALVLEKQALSKSASRTLVVYAGASWCEPCRRFHEAAEKGQLDAEFGDLDFLAFDVDIDNERLAYGNYDTETIPMLALPAADGRAGQKMSGSIKGEGAVGDLTPRLRTLLGRR